MASARQHHAPAHSGKPLDSFYRECLRVGCLNHLRYADLYLRGREELLIVVKVFALRGVLYEYGREKTISSLFTPSHWT